MAKQLHQLLGLEFGNRQQTRLSVRLPAVVTTRDGTRRVRLEDLSIRGARVTGAAHLHSDQDVLLQWGTCEAFGLVRWAVDGTCGIRFCATVSVKQLIDARELDDRAQQPVEREVVRRTADAFVNGRVRL